MLLAIATGPIAFLPAGRRFERFTRRNSTAGGDHRAGHCPDAGRAGPSRPDFAAAHSLDGWTVSAGALGSARKRRTASLARPAARARDTERSSARRAAANRLGRRLAR